MRVINNMEKIKEIKVQIEKMLKELDSYGYSREETLGELNEGFDTSIEENTYMEYHKLQTELKALQFAQKQMQDIKDKLKKNGKKRLGHLPSENYELYCEDIDKIFKDKKQC